MENENVLNVKRGEINALNEIISECIMGEGSKESNKSILKFIGKILKEVKEMEEFQKTAVDGVKTERFKELVEKQKENLTEEEQKEFDLLNESLNKKLNEIIILYFNEDTTIEIEKISEDDFFEFAFANKKKLNYNQIGFLSNILCKK